MTRYEDVSSKLLALLNHQERDSVRWLGHRTIFLTRHGSHAYGTNIATSDEDFKGVAIPPANYLYGFTDRFEQAEFHHQKDGLDAVIYDLRKFFKLAADCNPSIIEVLFTDVNDHVLLTRLGALMVAHRELFISKKAKHTFSGYAVAQLKKLKSHYRWIKNPPKEPPTRAEYGLPERTLIPSDQLQAAQAMIRKQVEKWNVPIDELDDAARIAVQERFTEALTLIKMGFKGDVIGILKAERQTQSDWPDSEIFTSYYKNEEERIQAGIEALFRTRMLDDLITKIQGAEPSLERIGGQLLGFSDNFLELLDKERAYRNRQEEWRSYQNWLATRNEARSELERKHGYDTKHGMHLVRLIRMGEEILSGKGVIVKRPDALELLEIRAGAWTYEELLAWADAKLDLLDGLYQSSKAVPNAPDRARLDKLCVNMVECAMEPQAWGFEPVPTT